MTPDTVERLLRRAALLELFDRYASALDNDRLEEWPGFFVDDARYEIIPRENVERGLPAAVMLCEGIGMLRDRVVSLRNANIYESVIYRHVMSGLEWSDRPDGTIEARTSYAVISTSQAGVSSLFQAGYYEDLILRTGETLRFRSRRCVFDTSRVQTLLAIPI